MFTFLPIQTIMEFIGYIISWIISIGIGVIVWSSLSQVGIRRASDGTIRNRGRFPKKKHKDLLLGSIIIFTVVLGVCLSVLGAPQEITRVIMVELERSGQTQSAQLITLILFVLLIAVPLFGVYIREKTKSRR